MKYWQVQKQMQVIAWHLNLQNAAFRPKFTEARLLVRAFELWSLVAQCDNDTKFVHCLKADD